MKIAGVLLAVLSLWGAGFGLLMLLWRGSRAVLLAELLGYSWILGAGVVTVLLALFGTVLPAPVCFPVVALLSVVLAAVGVGKLRRGGKVETGLAEGRTWEKWFCLLILVPIGFMTAVAWRDAIIWDGLIIWEVKARHAFLAGGALPAAYFADSTRVDFHPNYPLYLPFSELWVYLWTGEADQTAVKAIFPIFFAALILLLWSIIRRVGGRVWMATATAILPLFVPLMMNHGLGLLQGYADLLLGTVYLGAVGGLTVWRMRGIEGGWTLAAACAALLPWVKQEGLLLFASVVVLAIFIRGWRQWKPLAGFIAPGAVVLIGWRLAMRLVDAHPEAVFLSPTFENVWTHLPRLGIILQSLGFQLFQPTRWSLLWPGVVLAAGYLAWRRRRETPIVIVGIGLPLILDMVPYVLTRLDLVFHIVTSMERLIVQLSPVAVLSLGLALAASGRDGGKGEEKPVEAA